jgi:hypothetical protein
MISVVLRRELLLNSPRGLPHLEHLSHSNIVFAYIPTSSSSRRLVRRIRGWLQRIGRIHMHNRNLFRMIYRILLLVATSLIMRTSLRKFLGRSHCALTLSSEVTVFT